jgi:hypothetical protein
MREDSSLVTTPNIQHTTSHLLSFSSWLRVRLYHTKARSHEGGTPMEGPSLGGPL